MKFILYSLLLHGYFNVCTLHAMSDDIAIEEESISDAMDELGFKNGYATLPHSHMTLSSLALLHHYIAVGNDAENFIEQAKLSLISKGMEGIMLSADATQVTAYRYRACGYITVEKFAENYTSALSALVENLSQRHPDISCKIVQNICIDSAAKTLHFALRLQDDKQDFAYVVSFGYKLGRYGIEEIMWVCPDTYFILHRREFVKHMAACSFKTGYRYEDYKMGDALMDPANIKTFLLNALTHNVIQTTGLFMLLKKIGAWFFGAILLILYKFKGIWKRKK